MLFMQIQININRWHDSICKMFPYYFECCVQMGNSFAFKLFSTTTLIKLKLNTEELPIITRKVIVFSLFGFFSTTCRN